MTSARPLHRVLPAPGQTRAPRGVPRTPCRRLAGHAAGPRRHRLAQLLALRPRRRPPHRVLRDGVPRSGPGRHGRDRGQRALAGRDGASSSSTSTSRRTRASSSSPRCSTSRTSSRPASTSSVVETIHVRCNQRRERAPDHRNTHREVTMTSFDTIAPLLEKQAIELPSWAFGNSGTRFKVFATPGTPRDPEEKIADAAQVHKYTALAPNVALHIPWDKVDDFARSRALRRGPRRRARHDQLEHLPGRRLQVRRAHPRATR